MYMLLMYMICERVVGSSDVVSDDVRDSLLRFRRLYHVDHQTHLQLLQKHGWTEKQFEQGSKHQNQGDNKSFSSKSSSDPGSSSLGPNEDDVDISSLL
mmetsp:Transcript_33961/g.63005  ORF Transcript_33961/g.63005 Transcript_33961/m.63005 type:complete len:98 (+) Transcript_33961:269-562(+)